jgi:hypothetical protein
MMRREHRRDPAAKEAASTASTTPTGAGPTDAEGVASPIESVGGPTQLEAMPLLERTGPATKGAAAFRAAVMCRTNGSLRFFPWLRQPTRTHLKGDKCLPTARARVPSALAY